MLVKENDKIRLVKKMGEFDNIGEICTVTNVSKEGAITFMFGNGMHMGYMSPDEADKYFEKVVEREDNHMDNFKTGDLVVMTKTETWLEPMKVGNTYTVCAIEYGVVTLFSGVEESHYNVSEEIFNKYFKKVDEEFDFIDEMLVCSQINVTTVFDKCTIVACKLPNGFVIVESSSCVDPDDYDEDIGIANCFKRIKNRVAEMEAYVRHEDLYYENENDDDEDDGDDFECDGDCKNCEYNDDDNNK